MGPMRHLTGSHHEPPFGALHYTEDQTLRKAHPELWEKYELSPVQHCQPGDVIAHTSLTVHTAPPNRTNRFRWVYTSYRIPADTLYNGMQNRRFDGFGFELWKPFDHPKFPVVAE
jgi:ectoine hydroxylase-related dioxygenase (phytanoyl-CoA dioxygenase family)